MTENTAPNFGSVLVEITVIPGKIEEALKLFTDHPMGLKYTAKQPGFISVDVGTHAEKNSIVLMEKWVKKEDWVLYAATRQEANEGNTSWNKTFGVLVAGARFAPMDCRHHVSV